MDARTNAEAGTRFWGAAALVLPLCLAGSAGWAGASPPAPQPADAVGTVTGTLSLDQAIKRALAGNPELAATAWDVAVVEEKLAGAEAAGWPMVSAEAGYQRHLDARRLVAAR